MVYVDYIVILSQSRSEVDETKRALEAGFNFTYQGPLKLFLSIKF